MISPRRKRFFDFSNTDRLAPSVQQVLSHLEKVCLPWLGMPPHSPACGSIYEKERACRTLSKLPDAATPIPSGVLRRRCAVLYLLITRHSGKSALSTLCCTELRGVHTSCMTWCVHVQVLTLPTYLTLGRIGAIPLLLAGAQVCAEANRLSQHGVGGVLLSVRITHALRCAHSMVQPAWACCACLLRDLHPGCTDRLLGWLPGAADGALLPIAYQSAACCNRVSHKGASLC